jgi:K+-sensing histidine kinase KdpD
MARPNLELRFARSPMLRYGLAAASFAIALSLALLTQRYGFRNIEVPLFLFAIAITVWYGGIGPAILAVVLSSLAFDYYFTEPRYSFYVRSSELPYYAVFILFALLLTWFSAVRRRVEQQLLQSRDELQREVVKRSEQASLLNLTHDTIFVRNMNDTISYWNRGAEELYGWTDKEAIGRHSQELLQTTFPTPLEGIRAGHSPCRRHHPYVGMVRWSRRLRRLLQSALAGLYRSVCKASFGLGMGGCDSS